MDDINPIFGHHAVGNTDDAIHQPSVLNESIPNQTTGPTAVPDNPFCQLWPFNATVKDIELMPKRKVFQDRCAVEPRGRDEGAKKNECHRSDDIIESS
jgi:hypothetical protein